MVHYDGRDCSRLWLHRHVALGIVLAGSTFADVDAHSAVAIIFPEHMAYLIGLDVLEGDHNMVRPVELLVVTASAAIETRKTHVREDVALDAVLAPKVTALGSADSVAAPPFSL